MGGWTFPDILRKDLELSDLDDASLLEFHDSLHILWDKLIDGYITAIPDRWTLNETYLFHETILELLLERDIGHLSPINLLDEAKIYKSSEEVTVENPEEMAEESPDTDIIVGEDI